MACITCPFECGEKAEEAQNSGCLPTAGHIITMKRQTGNNWACHSNPSIKCKGLIEYNEQYKTGLDMESGELIKWEDVHGVEQNSAGTMNFHLVSDC